MQGLTPRRPSQKKAEMAPKSQKEGKFDWKQNDSTLIERIEFAITNIEKIRENSLESISAKYDWKNIVKYYDTAFEEMIYQKIFCYIKLILNKSFYQFL